MTTQFLILTADVTSVRAIEEMLRDGFRVRFDRTYSNVWIATEDAIADTAFESLEDLLEDLADALAYNEWELELVEDNDGEQTIIRSETN